MASQGNGKGGKGSDDWKPKNVGSFSDLFKDQNRVAREYKEKQQSAKGGCGQQGGQGGRGQQGGQGGQQGGMQGGQQRAQGDQGGSYPVQPPTKKHKH